MGDDDFVSLAIGFLLKELYPGPSICPTHIHVLEMDGRYIECLNRLSERFSLPISCEQVDLRMPLPPHLCGRFDCLFTDPPYTQEGASLFLSRAISVLKEESGLRIFSRSGTSRQRRFTFCKNVSNCTDWPSKICLPGSMNTWAHLFWATKDSSLSWKRQNVHAPCSLSKTRTR